MKRLIQTSVSEGVTVTRLSSSITLHRSPAQPPPASPRWGDRQSKPLLLLLPWLGAQPHSVERYRQIYYPEGYDVLTVESCLGHFLWPGRGLSHAARVLELLQSERFASRPLLLHAISLGGYTFSQMMILTLRDPSLHTAFSQRLTGQIYDSLVIGSLERMAKGVSQMLSHSRLEPLVRRLVLLYFGLFAGSTVRHYRTAVEVFRKLPCRAPALVFSCGDDPLSEWPELEGLLQSWRGKGLAVRSKHWARSRHAGHLRQHPREYRETLRSFLQSLGGLRLAAKL
ncbi:transmembrane protein 53-B [Callorhinchus milii]|uniref:Si:dkey-5i3.5 n=1 Tax=Callorhinchus milii TaxID=7868 RepID=A0A4W3J1Q1_CALMI|nr:transmembrane protein 53-B [Callorhinchus milii]XP_042191763.1 transmembrane protein 53-B [Callorhinchus milii]|eukprot:gi/632980981/ref/XP_007907338.1/ PREDICTED: transmembrane protein 53-like [Callorhinchus milii]